MTTTTYMSQLAGALELTQESFALQLRPRTPLHCSQSEILRIVRLVSDVQISGNGNQTAIPRNQVQGCQGAEMNPIYPHLRKQLGIKLRDVSFIGLLGVSMVVGDGRHITLRNFVIFKLHVEVIERTVRAFACPTES